MSQRVFVACTLLLCWVQAALSEITFEGETKVPAHSIAKVRAKSADYKSFIYKVFDAQGRRIKTEKGEAGWLLFTGMAGSYRVEAVAGRTDKDGNLILDESEVTVTIGGEPTPTPPTPPGPTPPGPTPTPEPTPDAPIPVAGFRVLVVYETGEVAKLPKEQAAVLYAKQVRDYLNSKCVTGADSKTREWRIWDKDVDASGEAKHWQAALARNRKGVPWIIISDGKTGFEGPLPASVDEMLRLLKKYGGE